MQYGLFALFVVIPLVEIALLAKVGAWLGFWWMLALIVGTAMAGVALLQTQGFHVMRRSLEALNSGKPPIGPVVDGAFLMLAGILLITPGVLADTAGLLLLIPGVRHTVAAWSVRRALRMGKVHVDVFTQRQAGRQGTSAGADSANKHWHKPAGPRPDAAPSDGPIIEGEFERLDERTVDPNRPTGRTRMNGAGTDQQRPR